MSSTLRVYLAFVAAQVVTGAPASHSISKIGRCGAFFNFSLIKAARTVIAVQNTAIVVRRRRMMVMAADLGIEHAFLFPPRYPSRENSLLMDLVALHVV
jgi:hypothetical protein